MKLRYRLRNTLNYLFKTAEGANLIVFPLFIGMLTGLIIRRETVWMTCILAFLVTRAYRRLLSPVTRWWREWRHGDLLLDAKDAGFSLALDATDQTTHCPACRSITTRATYYDATYGLCFPCGRVSRPGGRLLKDVSVRSLVRELVSSGKRDDIRARHLVARIQESQGRMDEAIQALRDMPGGADHLRELIYPEFRAVGGSIPPSKHPAPPPPPAPEYDVESEEPITLRSKR